MKKAMRIFTMLLALTMVFTLFTGCGSNTKVSEPAAKETAKKEEAKTETPAKKVKIKFAAWDTTLAGNEFKVVVDNFNKQSKTTEVEIIDASGKDFQDKLNISLAGGDDIDVYGIKDMPQYSSHITKKQVLALDDLIKKDGFDISPYGKGLDVLKVDGKTLALPFRSDFWILFYNKDLFDKAKLPYPTADMTWDQYRELAKKLTSGEGNDKVWGSFFHTWLSCTNNLMIAQGKNTMIDGKYDFLKPAYDLRLNLEQVDKSQMAYASIKSTNSHYRTMFESGKVAMLPMATFFIGTMISEKKAGKHNVNWGITKLPHFADGKSGDSVFNYTPVAINAGTKNRDAAWEFMRYLCGEPGALTIAKLGVMPAYSTKNVLDTYSSIEGFPADGKPALESPNAFIEFPVHKNAAQISKAIDEEAQMILIKSKNIDDGLKAMETKVKDLIGSK
ncbi:MAG: sugar ABC transporter substrate-binding protein [Clostridia bacterium]|nr:sugar ABC transporter substrate-binding protein [Clostridia bacterium]